MSTGIAHRNYITKFLEESTTQSAIFKKMEIRYKKTLITLNLIHTYPYNTIFF